MSLVSLLLVLLLLAVIAAIAVLASGGGGSYADQPGDRAPYGRLPPGPVTTDDVRGLRFSLAFRGYRMDEVDAVLARLTDELEDREQRLREQEQPAGADPGFAAEPPLPPWTQT